MSALRTTPRSTDAGSGELARVLALFVHEEQAGSPLERCIDAGITDLALIDPRGVGTADALYRNRGLIEAFEPDYALVHAGEEVCRADYRSLLDAHIDGGLGATVACVEMPIAAAREFGVVGLGQGGRVVRYAHQPAQPQPRPHDVTTALVSTGTFVFDRELLIDLLSVDAADRWSGHDVSRDLLPILIQAGGVSAYVFRRD